MLLYFPERSITEPLFARVPNPALTRLSFPNHNAASPALFCRIMPGEIGIAPVDNPIVLLLSVTKSFDVGFVVPIPNELVEGFHTNKSSVLTVVNPAVTSTNGMYLGVFVESEETVIEPAVPACEPAGP